MWQFLFLHVFLLTFPSFSLISFKIFYTQSVVSPHFNSSSDSITPLNSCDQRPRRKSDVNRDQGERERDFIPPIRRIEGTHHPSKFRWSDFLFSVVRWSDFLFSVVRARGEHVRKHWHTHYVGCGQLLCGLVCVSRVCVEWKLAGIFWRSVEMCSIIN